MVGGRGAGLGAGAGRRGCRRASRQGGAIAQCGKVLAGFGFLELHACVIGHVGLIRHRHEGNIRQIDFRETSRNADHRRDAGQTFIDREVFRDHIGESVELGQIRQGAFTLDLADHGAEEVLLGLNAGQVAGVTKGVTGPDEGEGLFALDEAFAGREFEPGSVVVVQGMVNADLHPAERIGELLDGGEVGQHEVVNGQAGEVINGRYGTAWPHFQCGVELAGRGSENGGTAISGRAIGNWHDEVAGETCHGHMAVVGRDVHEQHDVGISLARGIVDGAVLAVSTIAGVGAQDQDLQGSGVLNLGLTGGVISHPDVETGGGDIVLELQDQETCPGKTNNQQSGNTERGDSEPERRVGVWPKVPS